MKKKQVSKATRARRSITPRAPKHTRAGGTATASGMDFEFRVGAWVSAQILAERSATLPWNMAPSTTFEFLRLETEQPVDDVLVGTSENGYIFIQVKHSLTLERGTNSSLASCIDQFVRQVLAHRGSPSVASRPWERALQPNMDRLVLITGANVPASIKSVLPNVLGRLRQLSSLQPLQDAATNQQERGALSVLQDHISRSWQQVLGTAPADIDVRQVLSLMRVEVINVDPGGSSEQDAKNLLRTVVLREPSQVDLAWNTLIASSADFARNRGGGDRKRLQAILISVGIDLQTPISYRKDIDRLREYTRLTLQLVSDLSRIRIGTKQVRIERPAALALYSAAGTGSLVIVGEPGAGKSGALHDVVDRLLTEGKDVVFLAIDRLEAQNLDGLRDEIGLTRYLSDLLTEWPGNEPGYLIIDALDAARSDRTARMIRDLVAQVMSNGGRWQIIVSIRKYDLRHNPDLRQLFVGRPVPGFADVEFAEVRHVHIPKLTDEELAQISMQAPDLASVVDHANAELRELLRVPFNLRLIGELLGAGAVMEDLSPIHTQIELLDRYWLHRVIRIDGYDDQRESLLRYAVEAMVRARALHIDRAELGNHINSSTLHDLLSSQVLSEWQPSANSTPNRYVLTFAHNVLFDYAVSRLLFRGSPNALVDLLVADPELVLAIRPSIVFHFQHTWFNDPGRQEFWNLVLRVAAANNVREIGRLIGPSVAANLAKQIVDFDSLVSTIESNSGTQQQLGEQALRHVFGTLITENEGQHISLVGEDTGPWCELIERVSRSMRAPIAYAVRMFLTPLCMQPMVLTVEQRRDAGLAARRLLEFAWAQEQNNTDRWLINHALEAVCRTFESAPSDSANLIRQSLESEHLSRHGFEEMPRLAHEIGRLMVFDPDLVEEIYVAVFGYEESSDAPTSISGSRIFNLVSNRRQDLGLARYALSEAFTLFLQRAPLQATRALIDVTLAYIEERHTPREVIDEVFQFNNHEAHIVMDSSVIWDSSSTYYHDEPMKMLNAFSAYLDERARDSANTEEIRSIISLIVSQNRVAVLWKRLLVCGTAAPETIGLEIRPLAWSIPILIGYDTTIAAGNFLSAVFHRLEQDDRECIERVIISIPDQFPADKVEAAIRIRNRLLGCLPETGIVTEETRQLLAELHAADAVPPNTPLYRFGEVTSRPYTDEEYLSDEGVSLTNDSNRRVYDLMKPIKDFAGRFLNSTPATAEVASIFPVLVNLHKTLQESGADVPAKLSMLGWGYLAEACERVAGCDDIVCNNELGRFTRSCLLEASQDAEPRPNQAQDEQFDQFASWGSPSARIDSAGGLILLARQPSCADDEVLRAIETLSRDPVPSVRFHIAIKLNLLSRTAPDLMWQILERYGHEETSSNVLQALVNEPFRRLSGSNIDHVLGLAQVIYTRTTDKVKFKNARQACLSFFADLYLWEGNTQCGSLLQAAADAPADSPDEARTILLHLRDLLTIGSADLPDPKLELVRQRAVELMQRTVFSISRTISEFNSLYHDKWNDLEPTEREMVQAIGQLAETASMELYFASGSFAEKDQGSNGRILSLSEKQRFLSEVGPSLDELAKLGITSATHHVVETLEALVPANPASVFLRIGQVVSAGQTGAYQFESLAADHIVHIVERYLAEYRYVLREEEECQRTLLEILDVFVQAGWPSARRLTYRLEEIFR